MSREEAAQVRENAEVQRREIEERAGETHLKVPMHLHQSSIADLKLGRRTSEKGIVERVGADPRPLIYASEIAGRRAGCPRRGVVHDVKEPARAGARTGRSSWGASVRTSVVVASPSAISMTRARPGKGGAGGRAPPPSGRRRGAFP